MTNVLAEVDAVGVLSSPTLPVEAGGGENPFFELQTFIVATQGNWQSSSVFRGGVAAIQALALQAGGVVPYGGQTYITPTFPSYRITPSQVSDAVQLFNSLNLYFEIVGYATFVAIPDAAYDDATPDYLPNSITAEDEPVSWRDWKDSTHEHYAFEGINYVPTCSDNNSSYISGSLIVQLLDDGYNVQELQNWPTAEQLETEV